MIVDVEFNLSYSYYLILHRIIANIALTKQFLKISDQTDFQFSRYHGQELKKCRFEKIAIKVIFSKTFAGPSIKTDTNKK